MNILSSTKYISAFAALSISALHEKEVIAQVKTLKYCTTSLKSSAVSSPNGGYICFKSFGAADILLFDRRKEFFFVVCNNESSMVNYYFLNDTANPKLVELGVVPVGCILGHAHSLYGKGFSGVFSGTWRTLIERDMNPSSDAKREWYWQSLKEGQKGTLVNFRTKKINGSYTFRNFQVCHKRGHSNSGVKFTVTFIKGDTKSNKDIIAGASEIACAEGEADMVLIRRHTQSSGSNPTYAKISWTVCADTRNPICKAHLQP